MAVFWLLQTPKIIQGKYFFEKNANLSTRQINQLYSICIGPYIKEKSGRKQNSNLHPQLLPCILLFKYYLDW